MATVQDGFKLECAFASGPFDSAPTWTDITAYWRLSSSTDIERGRQSEQDTVSTGLLSLTLDNTDGRFTVGNTSSPYYPNVKLRKQIRITYTQSAVTYPIFKGYVDEWPVAWPDGGELYAWAQVRASDRFKPLGSPRVLRSVPEEEILSSTPSAYWPLGEGEGATQAGEISGNVAASLNVAQVGSGGTLTFGTGTGVPTDGLSAPQFTFVDGSNGKYLSAPIASVSGLGVSLLCVFRTSTTGVELVDVMDSTAAQIATLHVTAGGAIEAQLVGNVSLVVSGPNVVDGLTHGAWLTATSNGGSPSTVTLNLYLDGTLAATTNTAAGPNGFNFGPFVQVNVGAWRNSYSAGNLVFNGTMCHVAVFGSALSSTAVSKQNSALVTGFANESTGSRVGHVADWCGIATGDRTIATGNTASIRHVDTTGKTAQGFLQELADTEGGLVFMDPAGKLTFQARGARVNTTAALTLSAASQQVSPDVMYRSNDRLLLNDVTYSRDGGITYRATDTSSIADYGNVTTVRETYTTSDNEVRDHATWVVYTSKTPTARIEGLGVDMLTDSASRIAAVQLDLSSKVAITNMPTAAPGSTASVFVEGYTETIGLTEWTRVFNTSPADLYSPLWQLGTAGFSELGQTTTLNF